MGQKLDNDSFTDSLADLRPRVSHEEVMARLDEVIIRATARKRAL